MANDMLNTMQFDDAAVVGKLVEKSKLAKNRKLKKQN